MPNRSVKVKKYMPLSVMQPKKIIQLSQKMSHNLENPQTKFYQKISSGYRDITFFSTYPITQENPKI
jgi:hypothetical protein